MEFVSGCAGGVSSGPHGIGAMFAEVRVDADLGTAKVRRIVAVYDVGRIVNADIGEIDVSAINVRDYKLDSIGARGIGEIGITGKAAAVSNAIFPDQLPQLPDGLEQSLAIDGHCLGLQEG
jgi:CO/xanthine dehydrogenase Mo-binding subunit